MKIYSLVDSFGDILYTSTDKKLLEEIICDMFLEGFQEECQIAVDEHFINMEEPDDFTHTMIQKIWDSLITWYNEHWKIQETILI